MKRSKTNNPSQPIPNPSRMGADANPSRPYVVGREGWVQRVSPTAERTGWVAKPLTPDARLDLIADMLAAGVSFAVDARGTLNIGGTPSPELTERIRADGAGLAAHARRRDAHLKQPEGTPTT